MTTGGIIGVRRIVPLAVIAGAVALLFSLSAGAQSDIGGEQDLSGAAVSQGAESGIAFPVSELGNCGSKDECRAYCNEPGNMPSCIAFAKSHGLMNADDAARAEKFGRRLGQGGGPGGCRSPQECRSYCSDTAHLEECVAFADEQGFKDPGVREGKKILKYIESGGAMPGGCTSRETCEAYCRNFDHAEECFAFAEKSGIGPASAPGQFGREDGGPRIEEFRKFVEFAKRGETPGGCRTKESCETYCRDQTHVEECVAFGEKVGFVGPEEAQRIRKLGGKGPGGCTGQEACHAYCAEPAHQQECFRFAEENGFIPPEEVARMKEGMVRMRAGLDQAPDEVKACLHASLGGAIIEDIQAGKLTPGPEIGDRVRGCFERFGHQLRANSPFKNAPPEILSCLKEKLGVDVEEIRSGRMMPTPEMADAVRVCFQSMRMEESFEHEGRPGGGPPPAMMMDFLRSAPPQVAACIKEVIGGDIEKLQSGELAPPPDVKDKIRNCFEEFRPEQPMGGGMMQGGFQGGMQGGLQGGMQGGMQSGIQAGLQGGIQTGLQAGLQQGVFPANLPPQALECMRLILGEDGFLALKEKGVRPSPEAMQKVFACVAAKTNTTGEPKPYPQPYPAPQPYPDKTVCPTMPTIESCPVGQKKVVAFTSEQCGTYYRCALTDEPPPDPYPTKLPPPPPAPEQPGTYPGTYYPQPAPAPEPPPPDYVPPPTSGGGPSSAASIISTPFRAILKFLLGY